MATRTERRDITMTTPITAEGAVGDLMALTQWLSPAFPVSAYAYSHGLEAAIGAGKVTDAAGVEAWIETVLAAGSGRNDAILLAAGLAPGADLDALSDVAHALAGSAERWEETRAQGAAFAATRRAMGAEVPDRPYPLAVAEAARALDLAPETVVALYLQAFAGALVSVAVPGDAVMQALGGAAFGADLDAMEHETQEVRLFRT
jgi:urease accessory protein